MDSITYTALCNEPSEAVCTPVPYDGVNDGTVDSLSKCTEFNT